MSSVNKSNSRQPRKVCHKLYVQDMRHWWRTPLSSPTWTHSRVFQHPKLIHCMRTLICTLISFRKPYSWMPHIRRCARQDTLRYNETRQYDWQGHSQQLCCPHCCKPRKKTTQTFRSLPRIKNAPGGVCEQIPPPPLQPHHFSPSSHTDTHIIILSCFQPFRTNVIDDCSIMCMTANSWSLPSSLYLILLKKKLYKEEFLLQDYARERTLGFKLTTPNSYVVFHTLYPSEHHDAASHQGTERNPSKVPSHFLNKQLHFEVLE